MKRSDASRQLAELVLVRDLQRLRAQSEAMRASNEVHAGKTALAEREAARDDSVESWRACVAQPNVPQEIAGLWSAEIRHRDAAAGTAALALDAAQSELMRRAAEYDAAEMRHDTIKGLAREARKRDARKSDEMALEDASDRHAARRRR
jgi:hypothetical protein